MRRAATLPAAARALSENDAGPSPSSGTSTPDAPSVQGTELLSTTMCETEPPIIPFGATMSRTVVVRGRITGVTTVELDEPVPDKVTGVEIVLHMHEAAEDPAQELLDFLASLPAGTRSKEDIDRQIEEDRSAW
jgi:hypothetical protein